MPAGLKEAAVIRKLRKYTPTPFKAKDSVYDKQAADNAIAFIECLAHTKGTWAGKPFLLIDWQEQIIRDVFGTLKAERVSPVQHSVHRNTKEEWKV